MSQSHCSEQSLPAKLMKSPTSYQSWLKVPSCLGWDVLLLTLGECFRAQARGMTDKVAWHSCRQKEIWPLWLVAAQCTDLKAPHESVPALVLELDAYWCQVSSATIKVPSEEMSNCHSLNHQHRGKRENSLILHCQQWMRQNCQSPQRSPRQKSKPGIIQTAWWAQAHV